MSNDYAPMTDEELDHQRQLYHGPATELVRRLLATIDAERAAHASRKHRCPQCGKLSRDSTAGCDHCDIEDK